MRELLTVHQLILSNEATTHSSSCWKYWWVISWNKNWFETIQQWDNNRYLMSNISHDINRVIQVSVMEELESVSVTKITDVDLYCLEKIFQYLSLGDLLNVADSNTHLKAAAELVFKFRYATTQFDIMNKHPCHRRIPFSKWANNRNLEMEDKFPNRSLLWKHDITIKFDANFWTRIQFAIVLCSLLLFNQIHQQILCRSIDWNQNWFLSCD